MISESRKQELFEEFLVPIEEDLPDNIIYTLAYSTLAVVSRIRKLREAVESGMITEEEHKLIRKEEARRVLANNIWITKRNKKLGIPGYEDVDDDD